MSPFFRIKKAPARKKWKKAQKYRNHTLINSAGDFRQKPPGYTYKNFVSNFMFCTKLSTFNVQLTFWAHFRINHAKLAKFDGAMDAMIDCNSVDFVAPESNLDHDACVCLCLFFHPRLTAWTTSIAMVMKLKHNLIEN